MWLKITNLSFVAYINRVRQAMLWRGFVIELGLGPEYVHGPRYYG